MKFGFSIVGLIVFIIPMLINILYFMLPPANIDNNEEKNNKFLELIEQGSRVLFAIAICFFISNTELNYKSSLLYVSIIFLILYYIVWIRYFMNGRDIKILGEKFMFVPMPLAVFPVLYFLFAALWMKNYVAFAIMIIFGIAHNIISYQNLYVKK